MRTTPMCRILPGLLLLGLLAVACSDRSSPVDPDGIAPPEAASFDHGPACDLTQGIRSDVRDYFPNGSTERQVANGLAQDLQKACDAGNQVTGLATRLLGMVEDLLDDGRGGSATVGSRLANHLLACTDSLCSSAHVPGLELVPAMSEGGLFAVRGDLIEDDDQRPAVARNPISFGSNKALWGVEVDEPWVKIMGVENEDPPVPVLIYGNHPAGDGPVVSETEFGDIAFALNRWPGEGDDFAIDDKLHVGVCFESEITISDDLLERVQRNSTLLTPHQPGFCPTNSQGSSALSRAGSMLASVAAFARNLVAEPLMAMIRADRNVGSVGGSPQSFSEFTAVAADPQGTLELDKGPNPVVVVGQDIGEIRVQALSGSGTPVERVKVVLSVDNNSGAPAGAVLSGDTEAFTDEEDGIATFESVQVNKAGGYTVCATGTLDGFTFEPVCTEMFHARNN